MLAILTLNAAQAERRLANAPVLDLILGRLVQAGATRLLLRAQDNPESATNAATASISRLRLALPLATSLQTELATAHAPIICADAGLLWLDGPSPALTRLAQALTPGVHGALLVHRGFMVQADTGFGDLFVDPLGLPTPRGDQEIAPYLNTGLLLARKTLFEAATTPAEAITQAIAHQTLRAVVHDGLWFPIRTEEECHEAELALAAQLTGPTT